MLEQWLNHPHAAPWLLVMWIAGLLGSLGHCAGMCGPIVAAFGLAQARRDDRALPGHHVGVEGGTQSEPRRAGGPPSQNQHGGRNWTRHLRFQLGRITTYTLLGALIGFLGGFARLQTLQDMHACCRPEGAALIAAQAWPWQVWVKLGIGALMLLMGAAMALGGRADALMEFKLPAPLQKLMGKGLALGSLPYALGMLWGLIPCGLVYMMLLRTLDAGDWRMGAAGMTAFGLGNAPLLLGLGLASTRLSQAWKARLLRLGGLLVAAMGCAILWQALTLLRLQAAG